MATEVFVYSMNTSSKAGKWSRYIYPWNVDATAQLNDDLYLRSEDTIYIVDKNRIKDQDQFGEDVDIDLVIRWPYLDFGAPGRTKMMGGFDVVGRGQCDVQFGYNESNFSELTGPYTIEADTLPGGIIPMPIAAPSFSMQITFSSVNPANSISTEWLASNIYLQDFRITV